jgi:glucose/arabinose dehydrogenase
LSPERTSLTISFLVILGFAVIITFTEKFFVSAVDLSLIRDSFGCTKLGSTVQCDRMPYKFDSLELVGHTEPVSTINQTKFEPSEGVFGNALSIYGYSKQQFFTLPNLREVGPAFSVSFWMKQDPVYLGNSSVISYVNLAKTAGWYFEVRVVKAEKYIQFSITNTDGKIFTVSSSVGSGIFENVVGTFDGKTVKIYVNGFLKDSISFAGNYNPDANIPLNIGLNSYGVSWNGVIDELRLYNRVISDKEVNRLTDYSDYLHSSRSFSRDEGLIAYWPFDNGTQDIMGNRLSGNIVLQAVSMVFSPDGRLFFSVKDAGEIRIMMNDGSILEKPFVRLQDPATNSHQEVLGIALDPDFPKNHFVYAYFSLKDDKTRILRFTDFENNGTDQKVLIDNIPATKGSLQGALAFGPDDKLYIATDYSNNELEQDQDARSKVLRIDREGNIPPDNPSPKSPIYTFGHQNMFGITFDKHTGIGLVTEWGFHYDEINVLEKGRNYQFPARDQSPSAISSSQTGNNSATKPARIYYKMITPTQAIYYDGNKFPYLKGKFLIASYGEGSIYALSLNKTGSIVQEIAIRLPEIQGHVIAISQAPDGDLYVAGEKIAKLISIDRDTIGPLTYFIDEVSKGVQANGLSLNLTNKVLSMDLTKKNNGSGDGEGTSASIQLTIPKALLGGISNVTSDKYNKTSNAADKAVDAFQIKENRRVLNSGDTIINMKLNNNFIGDKILIKGTTSSLIQLPVRNIMIYR